jgi:hypothetical protein
LAKITGQRDIVVGTPVSGRTNNNAAEMVGMFVNTLAIRNYPKSQLTFYEFLVEVKSRVLSALENQDYPFETLVETLKLSGETNRNPLFDTMFTLQHFYEHIKEACIKSDEVTFSLYEMEYTGSMFDLALEAVVTESNIRLNFAYDCHLFSENTIHQMARHFITILTTAVHMPEQPIDKIDISIPSKELLPEKENNPPLTTHSKLPGTSLTGVGTAIKTDIPYTAPRTEVERQLVYLWAEILKLDEIGIDHNFFEMGGDSLSANLFLAKLKHRLNVDAKLKDLFAATTIRKFAGILSHLDAEKNTSIPIVPVEKKEYFPASSAQKRLFVIQQLNSLDTSYNLSMGMIIKGKLDKTRLENTIRQLIIRHDSLRTQFEMQDNKIVQIIKENPPVQVEFFERNGWNEQDIEKIIKRDILLSDLSPNIQEVEDNLLSTVKLTKVKRKPREI